MDDPLVIGAVYFAAVVVGWIIVGLVWLLALGFSKNWIFYLAMALTLVWLIITVVLGFAEKVAIIHFTWS